MTNDENCFDDPSNPGLMKSKIDHRSPSRFSIGVPVEGNAGIGLELFDGAGLLGRRDS